MTPLSPERIVEITKRQRVPAQIRQLDALGIRYAMRADKTLFVLEEEVRRVALGGEGRMAPKDHEPDWDALNAPRSPA